MLSDILNDLAGRARPLARRVAFPDALDVRTLCAANRLASEGTVVPVLVGPSGAIRSLASGEDIGLEGVEIEDPEDSAHRPGLERDFAAMDTGTSNPVGGGGRFPLNPLLFAGMMARAGIVHGSVAGSVSTTPEVIRAALRTVGLRRGVKKVSSYFLMIFPGRVFAFADCGVIPDPGEDDLAEIAGLAADNYRLVTGARPVVAFLSFSTKGSASHPMVARMRGAASAFHALRPDIASDGELQLDAAIVPEVAGLKAPESPAAGRANVLIFPDLNAGNIGYKLAQRLGGAVALGPILQGLAKPVFDLSRGCGVDDIVHTAAINALTAG